MHCVCCPIALVSPRPETGNETCVRRREKEEKKKKKKKSGPASTVWPRDEDRESLVRARGVARSDASEGYAPRVCAERGTERRRNARPMHPPTCIAESGGVQVYTRGQSFAAARPITYWFFTYDLIHYHSVIYICPACCRDFADFADFVTPSGGRRERVDGWTRRKPAVPLGGWGRKKKKECKKQSVYTLEYMCVTPGQSRIGLWFADVFRAANLSPVIGVVFCQEEDRCLSLVSKESLESC